MSGWGVKVLYSNRTPLPPQEEKELGNARHMSLPELFAQSDIISLHCPLTPETRHLINPATLSQCKKGVYIVNTSRGPVVDEIALVEALKTGQVRRAGLDVFEREPQVEKDLLDMDYVVLSPHYAAFTNECSMSSLHDTSHIGSGGFRRRSPSEYARLHLERKTEYSRESTTVEIMRERNRQIKDNAYKRLTLLTSLPSGHLHFSLPSKLCLTNTKMRSSSG